MRLAVRGGEARVTLQGGKISESGIWMTDLFNSKSSLEPIVPAGNYGRIEQASPGMDWFTVSTAPSKTYKTAKQLVHAPRWSAQYLRFIPLDGIKLQYVSKFSADGKWLAAGGPRVQLFDLRRLADSGVPGPAIEIPAYDIALGQRRPPMFIDEKGNLQAVVPGFERRLVCPPRDRHCSRSLGRLR
jgi:hypothetical protein